MCLSYIVERVLMLAIPAEESEQSHRDSPMKTILNVHQDSGAGERGRKIVIGLPGVVFGLSYPFWIFYLRYKEAGSLSVTQVAG